MDARARKRTLSVAFPTLAEDADTAKMSWRSGLHSDWTLRVGHDVFHVHKVIVGTGERRSLFFAAAFRKPCGETSESDLTELLPAACRPVFEQVLDHMYGEPVVLASDNWAPIMKLADVMQMPELIRRCAEECDDILRPSNAIDMCAAAFECCLDQGVSAQLIQLAAERIAPCFVSAPTDKGVRCVDAIVHNIGSPKGVWALDLLVEMLRQDSLMVRSEDEVVNVIQEVVPKVSLDDATRLWRHCRFQAVSPSKILEVAAAVPSEALAWALARIGCSADLSCKLPHGVPPAGPRQSYAAVHEPSEQFRSIRLSIADPRTFSTGEMISSFWRPLSSEYSFSLVVFPAGKKYLIPGEIYAAVRVRSRGQTTGWSIAVQWQVMFLNIESSKHVAKSGKHKFSRSSFYSGRGCFSGLMQASVSQESGWLDKDNRFHLELVVCDDSQS